MREKKEAQQLVRALRSQGLSYREILARVRVSKSSVSLWCRDVELEPHQNQVLRERKLIAGHQGLEKIAALRAAGRLKRRPSQRGKKPGIAITNGSELDKIRKLYEVERLSVREVAAKSGMSFWRVYELMRNHGVTRRRGSDQNYATYKSKPQFELRPSLTVEEERLQVAGAMLYWA